MGVGRCGMGISCKGGGSYYSWLVIGDIRKHLSTTPFVPFTILMADGREYPVPRIDHIYVPPAGSRVVVSDDKGLVAVLPGLLITGLAHAGAH